MRLTIPISILTVRFYEGQCAIDGQWTECGIQAGGGSLNATGQCVPE
jgi:hypothetical protein